MKKPQINKGVEGFTLIEMLIAIAIIGILASVAIPQYSQYKIRGYDAQTKQALKNMHLLCNAYWLDTSTLQGCDLSKIKEPAYGFNQNADVVATLPPSPQDNFCASAKHNDSPNTFSIDSAALISSGSGCGGAGGSAQTASLSPAQTFEGYQPPENACSADGTWTAVDSNGKQVAEQGWIVCSCGVCGPGGSFSSEDGIATQPRPNNYKYVFGRPGHVGLPKNKNRYNFATGMWCDDDNTGCEDYSENPG